MLGAASSARSAVCLSDQLTGSCQSCQLTPADDNNQLCVTDSPRGSLSPVEETAETISTTTHRWRTTSGRRAHGSIATATELWTSPVRTRPAHHVTKSMFGYRAVVARYVTASPTRATDSFSTGLQLLFPASGLFICTEKRYYQSQPCI